MVAPVQVRNGTMCAWQIALIGPGDWDGNDRWIALGNHAPRTPFLNRHDVWPLSLTHQRLFLTHTSFLPQASPSPVVWRAPMPLWAGLGPTRKHADFNTHTHDTRDTRHT